MLGNTVRLLNLNTSLSPVTRLKLARKTPDSRLTVALIKKKDVKNQEVKIQEPRTNELRLTAFASGFT